MKVYLDNAATTRLDERVLDAMMPYLKEEFGNPSSIHAFGRSTRAAVERSRKKIADFLNVSPSEIFFTSCGTEANNMILNCAIRDLGVNCIITSRIEHHCVLHPVEYIAQHTHVQVQYVHLLDDGHIDPEHLEELLKNTQDKKTLVSLMHGNNEIGNLLNIKKVAALCEEYKAYFHSDTVQTLGHYTIDFQKLKVHFATGSGHKLHGPKGIGVLYMNADCPLKPYLLGGAQERNMRAGTENVAGIVGMGKALELACEELQEDMEYVKGLKNYMIEQLETQLPGVEFNGDAKGKSLYTVLNVRFSDHPSKDLLLFNLDIAGIAASAGSACSSGSNVGSHVLQEIDITGERPSIRFSFSKFNTREEIDFTMQKVREMYKS